MRTTNGRALGLGLSIGIAIGCGGNGPAPVDAYVPPEDAPVGEPLTIVVDDRDPAGGAIALQVESQAGIEQRLSASEGRFEIRVDWSRAPFAFSVSNGIRAVTVAGVDRDGIPGFAIVDGTLAIPIDAAPTERAEGPITVRVPLLPGATFVSTDEWISLGIGADAYVLRPNSGQPFRFFVAERDASGAYLRWAALSSSGVTTDTMLPFDWTANAAVGTPFEITVPHQGITTGPDWTRIARVTRALAGVPAERSPTLGSAFGVVRGDNVTFAGAYYDQSTYDVVTSLAVGGPEEVGHGAPQSTVHLAARPDGAPPLPEPFLPLVDVTSPEPGSTIAVGQPFQFTADADVAVQVGVGPAVDPRRWLIHYDPSRRELTLPSAPVDRSVLLNASRSVSGHVRLCDVPSGPASPLECERMSESYELLFGI